jgi:hypothetical protein
MNADGPIRPGHLHHDPPLHPTPRLSDPADPSTPRFRTVSPRSLSQGSVDQVLEMPAAVLASNRR